MSPSFPQSASSIPSPLRGERVGVRGERRNRTIQARNFARHLRKQPTDAEKCVWHLLRNPPFSNFKFRRQHPCDIYFLDFYCVRAKLAVELDGGGHHLPDQRTKDERRNQVLASKGMKILRFWNHQLQGEEVEAVRMEIWSALMERTGQTPHPNPLP